MRPYTSHEPDTYMHTPVAIPALPHNRPPLTSMDATAEDRTATSRVDASTRRNESVWTYVKRRFAWAQAAMTSHARKRRTR